MPIPFTGLGELATLLTLLGGAGVTVVKTFKFVQEGEQGIKLRFGKAVRRRNGAGERVPVIHDPGFTILIPYVDKLIRRHVRVQTLELAQQTITIKNGLSYIVDAVVRFKVTDIYKALFVVDDLDRVMTNVAMAELRDVLTPRETAASMSDVHAMSEELTGKLKRHEGTWGVALEQFSITSCVPTPESQQIVNVTAGVTARVEALQAGFKTLGMAEDAAIGQYPQLAAALIGIPVATAIGASPATTAQFATAAPPRKKQVVEDEAA